MRDSRNNINDSDTQEIIMCEFKMYAAVQVCLQKLHRPTFNRVAICYTEFKRCS